MDDSWMRLAECVRRRVDPNLYYPETGEPISLEAVAACRACPVRLRCLKFSMVREREVRSGGHPLRFGIWGGLTPQQRTRVAEGKRNADMTASFRDLNKNKARVAEKADAPASKTGA